MVERRISIRATNHYEVAEYRQMRQLMAVMRIEVLRMSYVMFMFKLLLDRRYITTSAILDSVRANPKS